MDKQYQPQEFEDKIYRQWEKAGAFKPTGKGKPYTIIMPPPNANDPLHIGHAMFVTVEDILARFERMQGKAVLWLPGTDHAGIETQYVFEKKLSKQGKSRFDFKREELYQMIWDYVKENSGVAIEQMKKLGASADWSRLKFTLDKDIQELVLDTFIKMHKEGLIYRGLKLVNYCTKCGTAFSNLETVHVEEKNKLYYVKYKIVGGGEVTVATTRPETIYADIAIAINPKHKKAKELRGKKVINPLTKMEMLIIEDKAVKLDFGTGMLKITPYHDQTDWEIWKRHEKELPQPWAVIGQGGKMNEKAGSLTGVKVVVAREEAIKQLSLEKIDENYQNSVAKCYRCGRTIEPLPLPQFFIKVKPLTELALKALKEKRVKIFGSGHEKILKHWLENLDDWNISRQIVWGIKIPAWFPTSQKASLGASRKYVVSKTSPGKDYVQETDTFDTWFSSAQWPVVTLKTNEKEDFERFYPTDLMETGYDILPFWVMRMLMMGLYLTGEVPFKNVYLHGLVRDEKGQKMSKSKGNAVSPVEVIEKYGADALRMSLVMSTTAGNDSATGEGKIRGMRNLTNKIWNAARFVSEFLDETNKVGDKDEEFKTDLDSCVKVMTERLEKYKVGQAAEWIYDWFWHSYCDKYIELAKKGLVNKQLMIEGLRTLLKLLHPFVPFVTEAVWQQLPKTKEKLLITALWPPTSQNATLGTSRK